MKPSSSKLAAKIGGIIAVISLSAIFLPENLIHAQETIGMVPVWFPQTIIRHRLMK